MREEGLGGEFGLLEMSVICKAEEVNVEFIENITKGKELGEKKKGPQDRSLAPRSDKRGRLGCGGSG